MVTVFILNAFVVHLSSIATIHSLPIPMCGERKESPTKLLVALVRQFARRVCEHATDHAKRRAVKSSNILLLS
jgi:hypothetical protein